MFPTLEKVLELKLYSSAVLVTISTADSARDKNVVGIGNSGRCMSDARNLHPANFRKRVRYGVVQLCARNYA